MRRLLFLTAVLAVSLTVALPANAGNGTGATGSVSSSAPGMTSGGVGSDIYWWDIKGTGHQSIVWPNDWTLSWQMGFWRNELDLKPESALLVTRSVQNIAANNPLWWSNACLTPGAKSALKGTACVGTSAPGQIHSVAPHDNTVGQRGVIAAWNVRVYEGPWIKTLTANGNDATSIGKYNKNGPTNPGTLLWARQVGLNGTSDGAGTDNKDWWTGNDGNGNYAVSTARLAGPLGILDAADQKTCKARYDAAVAKVQAHKGDALHYLNASSLGDWNADTCYWTLTPDRQSSTPVPDGTPTGNSLEGEVSLLSEVVPLKGGGSKVTFKLAGRANTAYCIVASSVDAREQLGAQPEPTSLFGATISSDGKTFIHCFVPKPTSPGISTSTPGCPINGVTYYHDSGPKLPAGWTWDGRNADGTWTKCSPPPTTCTIFGVSYQHGRDTLPDGYSWVQKPNGGWDCPASTPPPAPAVQPTVNLIQDNPIPTRIWALSSVEVNVPNLLPDSQSVIPDMVALHFFTPQSAYNGSITGQASSYPPYTTAAGPGYARFDSDGGKRPSVFGPNGFSYEDKLVQPAQLSVGNSNADFKLAQNDFRISWLQPTLSNPCNRDQLAALADWDPSNPGLTWPTDQGSCTAPAGKTITNAWDDSLVATANYEQRWVAKASDTRGWIHDQPLRCADPGNAAVVTVGGNGSSPCQGGSARMQFVDWGISPTYLAQQANATRQAEGYLYASSVGKNGEAAVAFTLDTSANLLGNLSVANRSVWSRTTGQPVDTSKAPLINPINGKPTLIFALPGLPAGATVATGGKGTSGDRTVATDELGDQGAATGGQNLAGGYALKWNWSAWDAAYNSSNDNCSTSAGPPPASRFSSPSLAAPVGQDGIDAGTVAWATTIGLYSAYGPTPLYDGNPDWSTLLREPDSHTGVTVDTIPYIGERPGTTPAACHRAVEQPTDHAASYSNGDWYPVGTQKEQVITGYQQVCSKWTQVPIKNKKGKITGYKDGAPCLKYVNGAPIYKTVTHTIYDFKVTGNWSPTNAAAQAITRTPSNPNGVPLNVNAHDQLENAWMTKLVKIMQDPTNWIKWDSPSGYAPSNLLPDWNVQGWTTFSTPGTIQHGSWGEGVQPGPGFGNGQAGGRLPSEQGYMVDWGFTGLSHEEMNDPSTYWTLNGSYDGIEWDMLSTEKTSVPSPESTATATVYAPRNVG